MTIQTSDLLMHSGKFILTAVVGAAIALITNHFYKEFEKYNNLKNDIYALLCKFFFTSSIQSSELMNHKKQIEYKLEKLETLRTASSHEEVISVVQDIVFDMNITISVNDLSETLFKLRGMKNFQPCDGSILQSFYLVNQKYCEVINCFIRFNEMKRSIKDLQHPMDFMLNHFEKRMPDVLTRIDATLRLREKTFDSCDNLLKKLGNRELRSLFKYKPKPRPTDLGEVVKLSNE